MKGPGCKGRNRNVREVDDGGLLKRDLGFHVRNALIGGDKSFNEMVLYLQGKVSCIRISEIVIFLQKLEREGKVKLYSRAAGKKKGTVVMFKAA
jgi:hypothetical protein